MIYDSQVYYCGYKVTALIQAWWWRRRGRRTSIGKLFEIDDIGLHHVGYWVTGVKT